MGVAGKDRLEQGSPTSRLQGTSFRISGGIRSEIKCTINVTHLNHPGTKAARPRQFVEKRSSSAKTALGAKKVGDRWTRRRLAQKK